MLLMQIMSECIPRKTISCKAVTPRLKAELLKLKGEKHKMFETWEIHESVEYLYNVQTTWKYIV